MEVAVVKKERLFCSMRLTIAVLGFFGFFISNAMRTSIAVAVVCMVNQTYLEIEGSQSSTEIFNNTNDVEVKEECIRDDMSNTNSTSDPGKEGEFEWSKQEIGIMLGAFFWGYMVSQIPAGWLSLKIGGAKVLGGFLLLMSVCNLLMPAAARINFWLLVVLRVISGIGSGVSYPAMHAIWGQWSPPHERSTLASIGYAGAQLGNVVALPLTGVLCEYGFDGGWASSFYIFGALGVLWCIVWLVVVADTPEKARFISTTERAYILDSLKGQTDEIETQKSTSVPWLSMGKSMAVWAIVVGNLCGDFGFYIFETCQPTYLKEVLKFDIKSNGLFAAMPYLLFWVIVLIIGPLADKLRSTVLSTRNTRKLCDSMGKFSAALMLVILGFLDCTRWPLAMTALVIGIGFLGFQWSGYLVNHVDLAPQYAGILMGISNCLACTAGIIGPYSVNVFTTHQTREEWQRVFLMVAAILVTGEIFYLIFAQGELQPWATKEIKKEETEAVGLPEEKAKMLEKNGESIDTKV